MYFVTARTIQARMLLTPSDAINEVIGGVLARAVSLTGVRLHGFVVTSNHVHLLVSAEGDRLSAFMQYFLGNVARKAGRLADWSGSFWQRRFAVEPVLDDEAAIGRLEYIVAHGVKEGLVRHPSEWPGLSCLELLLKGGTQIHRFFHWARRWKQGVLVEGGEQLLDARWAEPVPLELTPLPCWVRLKTQQRRTQVEALVERVVAAGAAAHRTVVGAQNVKDQHPHTRPLRSKKSPQPHCHASTSRARRDYRESVALWSAAFVRASREFRRGQWAVAFPAWAFRPPVGSGVASG
jgi:REP element-mobilizing transposase RayT